MKRQLSVIGGGGGLAELILLLSSWVGVTVSPGVAIWVAALLAGAALWMYHNGLDGLWSLIRHGDKKA